VITLDEAKRLKAAGWEQGQTEMKVYRDGKEVHGHRDSFLRWYSPPPASVLFDSPNSDELIAAIQERWNVGEYGMLTIEFRDGWARVGWEDDEELEYVINKQQGTPLSALVELYCKLAESD